MGLKIVNSIIRWLNHESPPRKIPLCDFDRIRYELKPCDVILVEGRSRVSSVIRRITSSPWTHAALYIGRLHDIQDGDTRARVKAHLTQDPDAQIIIESMLGRGTIATTLDSYHQDHLRICRPKGITYRDAQKVIQYAADRLGTLYDIRQVIDLARFLFPWAILPRRWRSSLFRYHPGKVTRTVCSTMIAEAFASIQFPILPLVKLNDAQNVQLFRRNPKLCVPADFDYSPYFEIIKYPFIDFADHATYRLLPWEGGSPPANESSAQLPQTGERFEHEPKQEQAKDPNSYFDPKFDPKSDHWLN